MRQNNNRFENYNYYFITQPKIMPEGGNDKNHQVQESINSKKNL
jgi:hypothetical protein